MLRKSTLLAIVLVLCTLMSKAQKEDYAADWKKIDALDAKGLAKDALSATVNIFNDAVAKGNEPQQIKAAMYRMRYRNLTEEENLPKNILFLDTLIRKAKSPAKNILLSMQAELYQNYRNDNRYKFYDRTALTEEKDNDISTWSIEAINKKIVALYKASLQNEEILKHSSVSAYYAILTKGKNTAELRPALFDFLGHRALEFFMSTENDVTNPSYKFIINDEKAFAPAREFISRRFPTKDSSSLYYNALLLMQDLLRFHLDDAQPDAFIDADLQRLNFVNENGIFENKETLYEAALKEIETRYSSSPASAQAAYLRAMISVARGNEYKPLTSPDHQFDLVKAKEILQKTYDKFPKSEGGINAYNLVLQIQDPALRFQTEKVNLPDQPFRALVSYKNTDKVYFRAVKTNRDEIKSLDQFSGNSTKVSAILALTALRTWSIALPDQKDFQSHSAEIKIDALPAGTYFIIASRNENFSLQSNIISSSIAYVSNISYVINDKNDMYVLNRDNGEPLQNTAVQLWKRTYDYINRKYADAKFTNYVTDKNGYAKLGTTVNYETVFIQLKHGADELFTDEAHSTYYYNDAEPEKGTFKTFLFTDRAIYRPGQTVFFKGIMTFTDKTGRKTDLLTGKKTKVFLYDENEQEVGSVNVSSNEYGSYSSSFKLPEGLLNGNFTIKDSLTESDQSFSVEEYKRPKFSAEIKAPEGSYRVNDSIHVTGMAKAYAGNNIDGAKVTYRVVRVARYPIWFGYYSRGFYPRNTEEQEITNGETVTDAKGEFHINFKAIPDETIDKKNDPTFDYTVSADITDINGETRSASINVSVSYKAVELNIIGESYLLADSIHTIGISSVNRNGLFEKVTVNFSMYRLQDPGRVFRSRFWDEPDQFTMTKDEYYKNFPYDVYADEDNQEKWAQGEKLIDVTDTTSATDKFKHPSQALSPGWYKIIVTGKDKFGEDIRTEKIIKILDKDPSKTDDVISYTLNQSTYQPGDELKYTVSTVFDKIMPVQTIIRPEDKLKTEFPVISNKNTFTNKFGVTEKDRGGIMISYVFVKHNRYYEGYQNVYVPWSNKELDISYETFRDKILPGSAEKWKIKIKGEKAEKVAAETLISMYDASLDQFKDHSWSSLSELWPSFYNNNTWRGATFGFINSNSLAAITQKYLNGIEKQYAGFNDERWADANYRVRGYLKNAYAKTSTVTLAADADNMKYIAAAPMAVSGTVTYGAFTQTESFLKGQKGDANLSFFSVTTDTTRAGIKDEKKGMTAVNPRKNFNETAFFFPQLLTDSAGNVEFSFTMPEALTEWKMMVLAHTKELASGYSEKKTVTQKDLMVQPNAPRFLREGDQMEFSAKVVNLSDKEITGTSQLELLDAATNQSVDGWFKNIFPNQYFTVPAGQSVAIKFPVEVPMNFNSAMVYRIKAISKDGAFSDGEENAIPVLSNRTLVTETLPLSMRNKASRNFHFDKLLNNSSSPTLTNHALTIEYTSNPVWYAVQALPYLMEYPYECAEQSFNRYYANTLASKIANSNPKIRAVFDKWAAASGADSAALISNLNKNEDLKSVLLQETPWVLNAKNEEQQKKNIAMLFNLVKLAAGKTKTLDKLLALQTPNGGFSWFSGGPDDQYITQYIISGIGHLKTLKALDEKDMISLQKIIDAALPYLDARIKEEYNNLVKYKADLSKDHLSYTAIQYLYMRSFFPETKISTAADKAVAYYKTQAAKFWLSENRYMQAMIALAVNRDNNKKTAKEIIESLRQTSINDPELGMYWKDMSRGGYYWYQSPVESQAMMIEAFREISGNNEIVNDLSTWLIKNKQTNQWSNTKATAEACYALLLQNDQLNSDPEITIRLGNTTINSRNENKESGTGYFKKTIPGDQVEQGMGNITVSVSSPAVTAGTNVPPSYGAVYWQYFEDLDKITPAETGLKIFKKLFIEKNSDRGPVLAPIKDGDQLKTGDKIKVRIELHADRELEYVHMKDMRAACMEPVNVLSEYKWQGGLGYYESTKDASTNFFFDHLPKGTFVFEYTMFVTLNGNFSNGITSIQCMYAPEFTSHSEGIRVSVE